MKRYLLLLLLIVTQQYAHAQTTHLSFDHLGINQGLPDNSVNDIKQDKQGYMWFVTFNGIVRYDGYRLKVYKPGMGDKSNVPNSLFVSIVEDKNHNLWVNHWSNGLFKYDRSADRFIQYKNKGHEKEGLSFIVGMDSTGKIWSYFFRIGSPGVTLQQFDPATGIFKKYGYDQRGVHYLNTKQSSTYIDHQGKIWEGTGNGLYRYDPSSDSFTAAYLVAADTTKRKIINMIDQEKSMPGKLWISVTDQKDKHRHLLLLDTRSGQTEEFKHLAEDKTSLANDTVNVVCEDKKHRLWLGTNYGLSLYNDKTKQFTNYTPVDTIHNKYKNQVYSLQEGMGGTLWMTSGDGLLSFNPETSVFNRYVHDKDDPSSINSNSINNNKMLFDREGTLWMGLANNGGGGADRVNTFKSAFTPINSNGQKFPWHDIHDIVKGPDGLWWVAAEHGLYKYDKVNSAIKLITPETVYPVFVAKNGLVYYGPTDKSGNADGFRVYDPKTGKTVQYKTNAKDSTSLTSNFVTNMIEDHTGIIWISTGEKGMCAFDPNTKKFKRYPYISNDFTKVSHNVLDDAQAAIMYEDRAGTLWVGTTFGGLNHFDRKKNTFISTFRPQNGLCTATSITQDKKGRLWVGSYINGLFLVDSHTGTVIKRFTEKDGLLHDQVLFINTDQSNFIWAATKRGFSRVNTDDFSIKNYKAEGNTWEGIFNESFGVVEVDGNMVIWGGDKMVSFNPKTVTKDADPPLVHIQNIAYSDPRGAKDTSTSVETYGKSQIELPWNQNKITFNFVALHYVNPAENRYTYRLEGSDNHWVQAGSQRSVTYTNLLPGTYTFRVKAANSDGVWNNKGDSFIVTILAPLWFRWWALVIYLILFVAAIRAYIVFRSRKLLRDKLVLEETVEIRTAEVREQKEEILQQKEEIEAQAEQAVKQASVDRVRAEIASMRSTNDLEKITPVIWNELTILGVPFTRCGVFIMDEQEAEIHTYLSTPDGKPLAAYQIPFNTEGFGKDILLNWRKHQAYTDHWGEKQFKEYSKNLVEQGAVESQEKYLAALPTAGLDLHFVPFLQGMLYVGNTAPLSDDEMKAVQLLAEAFSTAYARYEDFNKLEAAKKQVDLTLTDLKSAQTQLIQTEKMASLGELTAGIAHEIQNPLNFVNNFSEVNTELIDEMKESVAKGNLEEVLELADDIRENQQKISWHGKRADAIVKGMLEHARKSNGAKEATDINALADEYLRLSYHGLRAKDKAFNALLTQKLDPALPKAEVIPQDVGRVLLNLFNNAFYAVYEKQKKSGPDFKPEVSVTTSALKGHVLIKVRDNGNGIPDNVKDKIMQPFFTTKPTGEGTGLGLSLSYDIVVKVHGGSIDLDTKEGEYTEFTITLPL